MGQETDNGRTLRQMPWWLWPDALGLLAPVAAFSWQWLFAEASDVRLLPSVHRSLILVVWIVALADRLLEAKHRRRTWRHWFAWRFRHPMTVSAIVATGLGIWELLYHVPESIVSLGRYLAIPLFFYLFFARVEGGLRMAIPREITRGAMFSAGVLLSTVGIASVPPSMMEILVGQTLLVSLMFLGVCCREEAPARTAEWGQVDQRLPVWLMVLCGTLVWLIMHGADDPGAYLAYYYGAMVAAGAIYLVGYFFRARMSADSLHSLAWVALAAPLLAFPLLQLNKEEKTALAPNRPLQDERAVGL